jgi:signal transduction histidine kinase
MNLTLPHSRPWFSTAIGLAVIGIVIIGFSRTYYLKAFFDTGPLTVRLHLHGFALSAWLVLFLVQARLIATHRRTLHMRLGIAGAILAALAVVTTYAAAFEFAAHEVAQDAHTAISRLYSSLQLATLFGLFVAAGILFRSRPEIHKRLMLLAMLALVGPGAHRAVTLIVGHGAPHSHVLVIAVLLVGCLVYDWRTRGSPHPALLCGGVLLIALQWSRRLVGGSDLWQQIGNWLMS